MVIGNPDTPTYGLCLCFIFFDIHDIIIASQIQVANASGKSHHIVSPMAHSAQLIPCIYKNVKYCFRLLGH
jgi:hypothetical protein